MSGTSRISIPHTYPFSNMTTPADPNTLKKLESQIQKEAKAEEKHVQHVLKDLHSTEKSDGKAEKVSLLSKGT